MLVPFLKDRGICMYIGLHTCINTSLHKSLLTEDSSSVTCSHAADILRKDLGSAALLSLAFPGCGCHHIC